MDKEEILYVRNTVALLSSMVRCGSRHDSLTLEQVESAMTILEKMQKLLNDRDIMLSKPDAQGVKTGL